ncbi:MAG: hypothetical protein BGO98_32970 [Myxococcales bacterium 68-20]|nr:MAG: hypothetical protein BGO98_32970 [Myxococcales bacterium 68-20]
MAPPLAMNAAPPYAYVVDYRPLDACAPPACRLKTRHVSGFADQIQPDGDPGAYVSAGHGINTELYYRRGVVLRPGEVFEFTLPPSAAASELDAYLSATASGGSYRANVTFSVVQPVGGPTDLESHPFDGKVEAFKVPTPATEGQSGRFLRHIRVPVPSRAGRLVRVTIANVGTEKMSLGSPLVMRKVDGRGPRQAIFAFFDAVPFHLMEAVLHGDTGEAKTAWVRTAIAKSGVYFPDAVSPGQATVNFFGRFLSGKLWAGRGWPALAGTGAVDDSLPEETSGPIARLAEEGFVTELVGDNFMLAPNLVHTGLDGAYQTESDTHASAMARYIVGWAEEHPRDDSLFILWNAQTHIRKPPPGTSGDYPPGRSSPPAPLPPGLRAEEVNLTPNTGVWRNLTDGIDHLQTELEALRRGAPDANRIVWIGADHSRGVTQKMRKRPFRALWGIGTDLSHGSANSVEEMRTPYALIFEEPSRPNIESSVVPGITSTLGAWRAVESRFGVDLGLTPSSMFDHPLFTGARVANPWNDRVFAAAGLVGSMRVVSGDLAYGLFSPVPTVAPIWTLPAGQQRVMMGAPTRNGPLVAEELYDGRADPYELKSIANERFEDVTRLRRELVDLVAAHYDPPAHPRNVYTLLLPERIQLRITSLGKLRVLVDGNVVPSIDPRSVVVTASRLEIVESEDPLGVVEIAALDRKAPVVLRCAANGLTLDALSDERPRLNLALARTNCPLPATGREVARSGEILFTVRPAQRHEMGAVRSLPVAGGAVQGGVDGDDFLAGMKRWGYVRDIDKGKQ